MTTGRLFATVTPRMPAIKVGGLHRWLADANGVGLVSNTCVADVDIVIASGRNTGI